MIKEKMSQGFVFVLEFYQDYEGVFDSFVFDALEKAQTFLEKYREAHPDCISQCRIFKQNMNATFEEAEEKNDGYHIILDEDVKQRNKKNNT